MKVANTGFLAASTTLDVLNSVFSVVAAEISTDTDTVMRVAIVGSGVSGLSALWVRRDPLQRRLSITR